MQKTNDIHVRIRAILLLLVFSFLRLSGQGVDNYFGEAPLSFKDRIAIRTNVVDWVLTSPNFAFDYDIVSTAYDKQSVGVGLKYNWNTTHTYIPKRVYNLFDVRFDYRFYWRQQPFDNRDNFYGDWEREWINSSKGFDKFRARANCFRAVEKPKTHISLFVGPYLSFSTFSIKLSAAEKSKGRQGWVVGAGLTGGVALPLYGYKNGSALDLEFGGSLGFHFAAYDHYRVSVENNEYSKTDHRNLFIPFPSDVRVSLVYRFRSISKQHTEIDYDLIDRRYVARLIELDEEAVELYNDSIRMLKDALDARNEEIALYKESVESQPGFNKAFTLEYFTPYKYMMSASKKYTRQNKDTLPKIHIDSIDQIVDAVMLSVREDIDSIPHVLSTQIDKEFVNQYNNISDADGKKVNRTSLIREIYTRLNGYIEDNNSKLVSGTFTSDVYSEKLNKYNVKTQGRTPVEITYKDSVRKIEMSSNEKIEWLNNIKKQAWSDMQKRMGGAYAARVNMSVASFDDMASDSLQNDSIMADSLRLDSLRLDSMRIDSTFVGAVLNDSLSADSVVSDSLYRSVKAEAPEKKSAAKAKKAEKASKASKAEKTPKAPKAPKAKKSKKEAVEPVDSVLDNGNIGTDEMRTDSIIPPVDVDLPADAPAEATALSFVGYADSEGYALYHRDYFIREEDED